MTGKILVELDYTITDNMGRKDVRLVHPDLEGMLSFSGSSLKMIGLQINELDASPEKDLDPLQSIIQNSTKLVEGVNQLKRTLFKQE